ncbi:MAG: cellulase family glycosylhydrolase [Eubacteriales bacterium]
MFFKSKKFIVSVVMLLTVIIIIGCDKDVEKEEEVDKDNNPSITEEANPYKDVFSFNNDDETKNEENEETNNNSEEKAQDNNLELEITESNSWESNNVSYKQLEFIVNNNGTKIIDNWSVEIKIAEGIKLDDIWNAKSNIENSTLIIKGDENNQKIPSGDNVTFGCIITGADKVNIDEAKLYSEGETINGNTEQNNNTNQNDTDSNTNEYVQPEIVSPKDVPEPTTDDWLYVKGNKIVDKNGKEVWITGVNWFGYNTGTNTFDGLWAADLNKSLAAIADRGFNMLRVPISSELILEWASGNPPSANFNNATNDYLVGMDSLQIFDYVVGQCRANGIKIMIDIHSAKTDPMGHMEPMWYEGDITEQDYLDSLSWIAERYKKDDTIIAYDLKNEPHGKPNESPRAIWNDSKSPDNWKYVAEKAAKAVLSKNSNALVLVEGIEIYPIDIKENGDYSSTNSKDYYFNWWGGNLRGVKDFPIDLGKYQNKLVYSPHDYGPTVHLQPWFEGGYTFNSLYEDCWKDNWMYIYEDEISPLLIGEWGGFMEDPNLKWMTYMRKLIIDNKLHHTFWCFNSNSGDTGGLVLGDFTTWDEEKYEFVKESLWQKEGKFVGLDQEIPLGKNGISLSEY